MDTPDFELYATSISLSVHEIASLCAGLTPPVKECCPRLPLDFDGDAEQVDLQFSYDRATHLLRQGVSEGGYQQHSSRAA